MNFERTQHVGHFGVVYTLIHFTIEPADAKSLNKLHFPEITEGHYDALQLIENTYSRMLAQGRPCQMKLAVSQPMSRNSADLLNEQRAQLGTIFGALGGKLASPLGSVVAKVVGIASSSATKDQLPTYHAGDVIISVDARVSGGIGPQRTSAALLVKVNGGR